jgi:uncharacterized protein (AIM24 family)
LKSQCRWCGAEVDSSLLTCPGCGATVERARHTTQSGWTELPPIMDMAKLRVGNSTCQIKGTYVPVADFNLSAGDRVYFTHHTLLWRDTQVAIRRKSLSGAWSRMFAGLPIVMAEAEGPGHVAFSRDEPGELIALPLNAGQSIDVAEHLLLLATASVTYDWFTSGIWYTTSNGKEQETHYPLGQFMDRFTAGSEPGLLLLHAGGNVFVRELAAEQTLLVKPKSLVYKDRTVRMGLRPEALMTSRFGMSRLMWLQLEGPGRVALQSAYEPIEDEGRAILDHSMIFIRQTATEIIARRAVQPFPTSIAQPSPDVPHHVDPRHDLIAKIAIEFLVGGQISTGKMERLMEIAAQHGLTAYDVRLIVNHVKSHGK